MELKKNERANLDKKRSLFFQMGLIIALGLVFVAFEWKAEPRIADVKWEPLPLDGITLPPITWQDEVKVPPPPPVVALDLLIVDDDNEIPSLENIFSVEASEQMEIAIVDLTQQTIQEVDEDDIVLFAEEMPTLNGEPADIAFRKFIAQNLRYPEVALQNGVSGKVFVEFIIDKSGYVTNVQLVKGVDPLLDNEAIRVIKSSPRWTAGKQQGVPVKVRFTFPIVFQLN